MGYRRKTEEKRRLKQLASKTATKYRGGAYWSWEKQRFMQWSFSDNSKTPKALRHQANKKVRNAENIPNCGGYKKVFNYWWKLT